MRSRNIKPGFFENEELASCEPLARLLFAGLWCYVDREGRCEDRPTKIKMKLLPADNCDGEALLAQLASKEGLILRYEADGKRFIQVLNFKKHQNPHVNESASQIPPPPLVNTIVQAPEDSSTSTVQALNSSGTNPASISDSLIAGIPDSKSVSHNDAPRREQATTAAELTDFDFCLRPYENEMQAWVQSVKRRMAQWNEEHPKQRFTWEPTTKSLETDLKGLIYGRSDEDKTRILLEAYNVLQERINWPRYVEEYIRFMLWYARDQGRVQAPYKWLKAMLGKPAALASARSDGVLSGRCVA